MGSLFTIRVTKKIRFKNHEICGPRTFFGLDLGTKEEQKAKIKFSFLGQKKETNHDQMVHRLVLKAVDL